LIEKGRNIVFLKDVLIVALTAFGGPQAHITVFLKRFCEKRKYLSEEELLEIYSICQMLPGPTSTQLITAIGYKKGGNWLALLTLLVWILPACSIMFLISLIFSRIPEIKSFLFLSKFIPSLAVAFMLHGFVILSKKVLSKKIFWAIAIFSCLISIVFNMPLIFPLLLIVSGLFTTFIYRTNYIAKKIEIDWKPVYIYAAVFLFIGFLSLVTKGRHIAILENNFRFGTLVFGGGQVLFPMMFEQYVIIKKYLTYNEFFSGFGVMQMLPGPVFSFATYTSSLSCKQQGLFYQWFGAVLGTVGIFSPGLFFVLFFYPLWNKIKNNPYFHNALGGITSSALGLILGAAYAFVEGMEKHIENYIFIAIAYTLLHFFRLKSGQMVIISILSAIVWHFFQIKIL